MDQGCFPDAKPAPAVRDLGVQPRPDRGRSARIATGTICELRVRQSQGGERDQLWKVDAGMERAQDASPEPRVHFDDVDLPALEILAQVDVRHPAPVEHGHELGHQAEHSVMFYELDGAGRTKTVG